MSEDLHHRIYISGPMTGHENHNFPAFHAAADRFAEAGWDVANPATNFGGRTDLPRASYLRADMILLTQCDAIAMLPGWQESRGATLEYINARELALEIYDAETGELMACEPEHRYSTTAELSDESLLDEAKRITASDRQNDYGHPTADFRKTALIWSAVLDDKLITPVTAEDVPLCMIGVRLARQSHRHKRDNLVDIAGYAQTAAMVAGDD